MIAALHMNKDTWEADQETGYKELKQEQIDLRSNRQL